MYNNFLQVANFFCGKSGERIFFGFIGSKEVDTVYYESQGVLCSDEGSEPPGSEMSSFRELRYVWQSYNIFL
jgi:hypothetical protein